MQKRSFMQHWSEQSNTPAGKTSIAFGALMIFLVFLIIPAFGISSVWLSMIIACPFLTVFYLLDALFKYRKKKKRLLAKKEVMTKEEKRDFWIFSLQKCAALLGALLLLSLIGFLCGV